MDPTPPPQTPQTPRRPRLKFLLLGAAGGALILLPLGQVLTYQGAELKALAAERAALDPFAHTLSVQHGVLAHREAADRVLRGRSLLEPERRVRQAELDDRLRRLQDTLSAGWWMRALQESQSMAGDWHQLARRIAQRQIKASDSQDAHQLLMEQAVQVMDLIHASAPGGSAGALAALASRQLHTQVDLSITKRQQQLAALEGALLAQDAHLRHREAAVAEQRATLGLALGALLALGFTLALLRGLAHRPGGSTNGAPPASVDERRNHGRRATDLALPRDETAPLIERLRSGEAPHTSEPR